MKISEIHRNKGRQSISELVTLHKLFPSKTQVPKFVNRIAPKVEHEILSVSYSSEDSEEDSDSTPNPTQTKSTKIVNE